METIDIKTATRSEMIDITSLVRTAIRKSGIESGVACLFCPHTTAAITIQESSDPLVRSEMVRRLAALVPWGGAERANENTDAHIKGSLIGASLTVIVEGGRPVLGDWQAIFFCEYDGPRTRKVLVRAVAAK